MHLPQPLKPLQQKVREYHGYFFLGIVLPNFEESDYYSHICIVDNGL